MFSSAPLFAQAQSFTYFCSQFVLPISSYHEIHVISIYGRIELLVVRFGWTVCLHWITWIRFGSLLEYMSEIVVRFRRQTK